MIRKQIAACQYHCAIINQEDLKAYMQYFKNVDLAKVHSVSEGTVRRWIDAARKGKLDLQLYEVNGRFCVANTTKNNLIIKDLVAKGKKHSNTRWHKLITPTPEFYDLYSKRQIVDLITNMDIHREIPLQYDYFGEGAEVWNAYANRLWEEEESNMLNATIELLQSNFDNIDRLIEGYERVNIVDIGVGNGLPVKELLAHLLYDQGVLGRYVGIDISQKMLQIAEKNISKWFKNRVNFEAHLRDISYERFDDLLVDEDPATTINIVLLFGGTLPNFRFPEEVLKAINQSIGRNSLFLTSIKLDTEEARRYFDFHVEPGMPKLPLDHRLMLDYLNIDESLYDVAQGYDAPSRMRHISILPKMDITMQFDIEHKERFVDLKKGEKILLWRALHYSALDVINILENTRFSLCEASITDNQDFILTISKVKDSTHL